MKPWTELCGAPDELAPPSFFTYHMPWWRQEGSPWRAAILPYFEAMGVPEHRVVRCLLAYSCGVRSPAAASQHESCGHPLTTGVG